LGTNGKGTTAVALAGALEAAGVRSGAYLSPHVLSYTERIMLGGNRVSEQDFAAVMGGVMTLADRHEVPATQFELLTAGALKLFRDRGAEWACLEAGLGARHDATSVTRSELVALTKLGLDHTEHPGSSVEEIAREKLASLRPGTRLILGTEDPKVVEVALQAREEVGAELVEVVERSGYLATVAEDLAPYLAYNVRVGIPALARGQIVVMDNLSVRKSARVGELFEERGAEARFLPAYSPDLNPIEEAFSKVKGVLRRAGARTLRELFEATHRALGAVMEQDARGFFVHSDRSGSAADETFR
jgi:hypothetical protein